MTIKLKDGDALVFKIPAVWEKVYKADVVGEVVNVFPEGYTEPLEVCIGNVENYLERGYYKLLFPVTNKYEKESKLETNLNIAQDIYFDVAKHAKAWGVTNVTASEIIQKELFKRGLTWACKYAIPQYCSALYLFADGKNSDIRYGNINRPKQLEATLQASTTYTLHIEQPKPEEEIVELMGKKYSKADIEEALRLLTPKEG